MKSPIVGPSYVSKSFNFADSACINLYPEVAEVHGGAKEIAALMMCPGTDWLVTAGIGPIRGLNVMGSTLFVVSGASVYSVSQSWAATLLGTINTLSGPVSLINNGTQVALFDGVNGYLTTGGALSTLSLPYANPVIGSYQDGFGLLVFAGRNQFAQSNLNDLSTWSALNFSSANSTPTNAVSIAELNREQWLFKPDSIEVWINAGLPGFAFQRLDGVFLEVGCVAPFSVAMTGETLVWLGQTKLGQGRVFMAQGISQARRISTHPVEEEFATYSTMADAIGYCYEQEGHVFYVLVFPQANATWAYDITSSALGRMPMWHKRASFNAMTGILNRHLSNAFAFFNGKCVVGDYLSGQLLALNPQTNLDSNGKDNVTRKWLRSWRALPQTPGSGPGARQPVKFSSLTVDMETGIDTSGGFGAINHMLRWSDDGGNTWSSQRQSPAYRVGQTAARVKFNRLGSTRRNSGLDRLFELSGAQNFRARIIGAELE